MALLDPVYHCWVGVKNGSFWLLAVYTCSFTLAVEGVSPQSVLWPPCLLFFVVPPAMVDSFPSGTVPSKLFYIEVALPSVLA